jgi:hypothetical protein
MKIFSLQILFVHFRRTHHNLVLNKPPYLRKPMTRWEQYMGHLPLVQAVPVHLLSSKVVIRGSASTGQQCILQHVRGELLSLYRL